MHGNKGLLEVGVALPQDERHHDGKTTNNGSDDGSRLPRIDSAAPGETKDKDNEAGCEERYSHVLIGVSIFMIKQRIEHPRQNS
jgi:hypothetical protein